MFTLAGMESFTHLNLQKKGNRIVSTFYKKKELYETYIITNTNDIK